MFDFDKQFIRQAHNDATCFDLVTSIVARFNLAKTFVDNENNYQFH